MTGGIWLTENGGDGTLHEDSARLWFDRVSLATSAKLCDSSGIGLRLWNDHCDEVEIISTGFEDPNSPLVTSGALTLDTIPAVGRILSTDGIDTLGIGWRPHLIAEKDTSYTTRIRIRYRSGTTGTEHDTTITLTLGAERGRTNYSLSTRNLTVSPTSMCNERDSAVTIRNFGCVTLRLTSATISNTTDFELISPVTNLTIPPGDELTIPFRFRPQTQGLLSTRLTLFLDYEGLPIEDIVFLDGLGTEGDGKLEYHPASFDFNTLSICGRDSGSGYITNTGCADLTLDNATIFSGGDYSMPGLPPITVGPEDTARYSVYLNPQQKGIRTGYIILTTTSRGGTRRDSLPLTVTVTDGTRILSSTLDSIDFGITTYCENRDTLVTFTNSGCDTLIINDPNWSGDLLAFGLWGNDPNGIFPMILLPGESKQFHIETLLRDTVGKTSNTMTLTFTSNADNTIAPIVLTRTYEAAPRYNVALEMADADGTAGDFVKLQIKAGDWWKADNVMRGVQRLDFELAMNTDLLHYISASGQNRVTGDGRRVTVEGNPEIVAPNGVLAEFTYQVHLTKDTMTDIVLSNLTLNNGDPTPCKPTIQGTGSGAFTYRYVCGDRAIQTFLRTGRAIDITSIRPNPARDEVTVEIVAEGAVTIEVYDAVGKLVQTSRASAGVVVVPVGMLSSGSYVLRATSGSGVVSRGFVVER